jgi:hypothetical protein
MDEEIETTPLVLAAAAPVKPVEHWAAAGAGEDCPPLAPWQFGAVRAFHRWPIGLEMSAEAFSDACNKALTAVIR